MARSRNRVIAKGLNRYSRAKMFKRAGAFRYAGEGSGAGKRKSKSGPAASLTRFYTADPKYTPRQRHFKPKTAKLRASITPGTVLILLSGRFKGKRVIFLQQLDSGLLLVTGPYGVNGVPLRRVNQAYVIATSTSVDISGVDVPEAATKDSFYAVSKAKRAQMWKEWRGDEERFYSNQKPAAAEVSDERKAVQAEVDAAMMALPELQDATFLSYLRSKFALTRGDKPHEMRF